ncbi:MAG: GNAT family N-acetyltransferase [Candidatus Micrarchaeaceae archaeon]
MKVLQEGFGIYLESIAIEDAQSVALEANDKGIADSIAEIGSFPYPYTLENAVSFIQGALAASMEGREFHFAVKTVADGTLVGACGIKNINSASLNAEIGYWIGRRHWRKGYGKQAASLLLEIAFKRLGLHRAYATVLAFNEGSIRILKAIGMTKEGVLREDSRIMDANGRIFADSEVFGILSGEYKPIGARFEP